MGLLDAFKNTNIFGARRPTYLEGIATPEQLKQAEQQSLVQGLLGTAVGYLAQPKDKGYGSAIPYLAQGYLQGMQSAQAPYQGLERDVLMQAKFQDIRREQDIANQQRQLTEQLLNDPRVKGNPLREQLALTNPVELSKQIEERINLREGAVLTDREGNILVENVKAPKAPEDKRSQLERMIDIYNTMPDTDPRKKVYGDYIAKQTTETSKTTTKTPSKPTNVDIDNVKKISEDLLKTDIDTAEAAVIASRANKKMADEKISFDEAVISIIEGATEIEKPTKAPLFNFNIPFTGGGKGVSKEKLLSPQNDNWKIKKLD